METSGPFSCLVIPALAAGEVPGPPKAQTSECVAVPDSGSAASGMTRTDHSTTLNLRLSKTRSTWARSRPRFSTWPPSPMTAHWPCFKRSAGRFSMR